MYWRGLIGVRTGIGKDKKKHTGLLKFKAMRWGVGTDMMTKVQYDQWVLRATEIFPFYKYYLSGSST